MRNDEGDASNAGDRELHEHVGGARADVERDQQELARLRARHADLERQIEVVAGETQNLERELLQKLASWRKLDDANVRVEDVLPQLRAVTGSLTYRLVHGVLHIGNRVLGVLSLRFLRR